MSAIAARICRYPVKGLSADELDAVELVAGECLPDDRRFALAHGSTRFDPSAPEWLSKTHFLMLMKNERLAKLQTAFDEATGTLTILRGGKRVVHARITTPIGRAVIEDFFAAYMGSEARGKPRLVEAPGHTFSDHAAKVVSLINLASVGDLERIVGRAVDPIRFRANVYLEGLEPWAEFDWLDTEIAAGRARLRVTRRIPRCPATDVDPRTGARDMAIPNALRTGFGHSDMGVYAVVVSGGVLARGDTVKPAP